MPRKTLSQQVQNLDARHSAGQAAAAKPLTARQAAAKMIAAAVKASKGTLQKR